MPQVEKPKRGGIVVGPPHNSDGTPGGGVRFLVKGTGKIVEEEGFEINIPHEIRDLPGIHTFKSKHIEILNQILQLGGYSITDKVEAVEPRDVVICVRSAWADEVNEYTGTIEEILSKINTSNGCKPIYSTGSPVLANGGSVAELNSKGGYNYYGKDKEIAKRCGLQTLPESVPGTNCGNCIFWGTGHCSHSKVLLPVTSRQCCKYWDDKSFGSHLRNIWDADFFTDKSKEYPLNDNGGYDYSGEALDRAREADLITLPEGIIGTTCAENNCMYGKPGKCIHPRIMLPVTDRQSCAWWDNENVIRPWGAPVETEFGQGGSVPDKGRKKDWQAENPNSPRWQKKKESIQELSNTIHKLRLNVAKDMQSEDERTALTALAIAIMDRTAERVGNDDSADNGHFGVTGFRKDHIRVVGNKIHLDYVGKSGTKHDKNISDLRIAKALKQAIKNAPGDFVFETSDGFRIKSDRINRYLEKFNISAKDIRGYNANRWIIDLLKKQDGHWQLFESNPVKAKKERNKIFNKAVKETAIRVGHGMATLKKHYMIPELPIEYIEHGKIIDMKNIGYFKDGGPLGDLRVQDYFANKNEVPDIVNKAIEKIHLEAQDEGMDKLFAGQEVKIVDWNDVVPTQDFLKSSKFNRLESVPDIYSIGLPWAVEYQGKYYTIDGHHRTVTMHKRSQPIKLLVYPIETTTMKTGSEVTPFLIPIIEDTALESLDAGGSVHSEKDKEAQEAARKILESLSSADIQEMKEGMQAIINNVLIEHETILNDLISKKNGLKAEDKQLYEKEKTLGYGPEKSEISERRNKIFFEIEKLEAPILHQKNIVKAIKNGGDLVSFEDKKGLEHKQIPSFSNIKADNISFDEETILIDAVPDYMPFINEDVFRSKGYVFDAIRVGQDKYLIAINGYAEKQHSGYRETSTVTSHPSDAQQGYIITTLDQLALISDYYFTKARAKAQKDADESTQQAEQYYDKLPRERRERHLNQKGFYHALPVKVKKIITQEAYEALSLEEKEKLYKPIKRYGAERLKSRLDDQHMWVSYHNMYERFINPEAKSPRPRTANTEVFNYWENFRDMMKWKIKDIQVQREVDSEVRKIALETSFGESNTDDVLKEQYGILVKRQNGTKIGPAEIEQIRKGWVLLNKTFGTMVENARTDNLKISHTGQKYVFASKAAGMYIPSMKTIAVSNKFGDNQFDQIFAHETAHWIDHNMGTLMGKRHATDDFESTAGIISSTFRKNMNAKSDSDYVNSTAECFARAMEQYFAFENYGEDAELLYSYGELKEVRTYHAEDKYVSKENFNTKIKPLIKQFLAENQEWFKFGIEPIPAPPKPVIQPKSTLPSTTEPKLPPHLQALVDDPKAQQRWEEILKEREKKSKYTIEDVTPAGYGPEEEKKTHSKESKPKKRMTQDSDHQPELFEEGGSIGMPEGKLTAEKVKEFFEGELPSKIPAEKKKIDLDDISDTLGNLPFKSLDIKPIPFKVNKMDEPLKNAVGTDDLRPAMMGIYYDPEHKQKVATNAQVLVVIKDKSIVTKKIVDPNTGKEIDARYPNYMAVIPINNPVKVNLTEDQVDNLLNELNGIARAKRFLKFRSDGKLEARIKQQDLEVYVNPALLMTAIKTLKQYGATGITLEFSSPNRAIMVVDSRNNGNKGLVMPVMYKDDFIYVDVLNKGTLSAQPESKQITVVSSKSPSKEVGEAGPKKDRKAQSSIHDCAVRLGRKGGLASAKARMDDGGGIAGNNCGCFHSFIRNEKPELVQRLEMEDVNSNPALRAQVDEAYQAWKGGSMNNGGGIDVDEIMKKQSERIDKMVEDWNKEGRAFSSISNEDSLFFERIGVPYEKVGITSQTGNDIIYYNTQIYASDKNAILKRQAIPEWIAGKSKANGINGYGKQGFKNIVDYSKQNPDAIYIITDDNYSHIGKFWLKNGRFANVQTLGNPNYDFANHPTRLSGKEDVIYKFKQINKK